MLLAVLAWTHRWMSDDGFINLRIVRNLVEGHGPVFNVGERVEAYTSPLWVALLAAGDLVTFGAPIEWVAVVLGIVLACAGLAAGCVASARLWHTRPGPRVGAVVPAGALVVVGLVPFWEYASSGLETGLSLAWLGVSFLAVVRHVGGDPAGPAPPGGRWPWRGTAVLVGLGPLVRPDFAIFAAAFLAVLVYWSWPSRRYRGLSALFWAALLPAAYQVFRMGYFAALVPNTALAKSAGDARWERGLVYLVNLVETYWLWAPLALLLALGARRVLALQRPGDRATVPLVLAPILAGLTHALYVVRVGGDFMHARLLLPSLFAGLLPVMFVALKRRAVEWFAVAAVAAWALVAATSLRYTEPEHRFRIDNLRQAFVDGTHEAHPVMPADFERLPLLWQVDGERLGLLAGHTRAVFALRAGPGPLRREARPPPSAEIPVVASFQAIGLAGYEAGPHVHVVDLHGLADPLAARTEAVQGFMAGHEKQLPNAWTLARFADPVSLRLSPPAAEEVAAARRALSCGDLRDLLSAVESPLDADRFLSNIVTSWRLRSLRIPSDPHQAERAFCAA